MIGIGARITHDFHQNRIKNGFHCRNCFAMTLNFSLLSGNPNIYGDGARAVYSAISNSEQSLSLAERGGFEPPVVFSYSRFPGVRLKPLSHLSSLA